MASKVQDFPEKDLEKRADNEDDYKKLKGKEPWEKTGLPGVPAPPRIVFADFQHATFPAQ